MWKYSTNMKEFYPYDGIRQFLQECFLLILSLVDVQQVNQELDGSTLENKIDLLTERENREISMKRMKML